MDLEQEVQKLRAELEHIKQDPRLNLRDTGLIWERTKTAESLTFESVYPYLAPKGNCFGFDNGQSDKNVLIEGDNLHALQIMQYTHKEAVDVIYIDPPYNTGKENDFRYNDKWINTEDGYKHSKWLEFMHNRLILAKNLLRDTGVIFISIDDNEQARLRLLCDGIFGESNFIANIIWAGGRKNNSIKVSVSHEYALVYSKTNLDAKRKWRIKKSGLDDIYKQFKQLKTIYKEDYSKIENALKKWYTSLGVESPAKQHSHYCCVDSKGIYFPNDISSPKAGDNKFDVLHPLTKKPCKTPSNGWRFSMSTMQQKLTENAIHFGLDENSVPCNKSYLVDHEQQVPSSVLYMDGRGASKRLQKLFGGDKIFSFPKDENVLASFINMAANKNATILDFFAGSGTTGHAVMELNREDGGNRKYILVTNNENNICEEVCYERQKRANEKFDYQSNLEYLKVETLAFDAEKQDANDIKDILKDNILTTIQFKEMRFKISNPVSGLYQLEGCTNPTYIINVEHIDAVEEISKTLLANSANDICVYWITMSSQNQDKLYIERALNSYKNLIDMELPIGYIKVLNDFVFGGTNAVSTPSLPEQEYGAPLDLQETDNYNEEV